MNGAYSYTEPYKCACGKKAILYVEHPLTRYDNIQMVRTYVCVECLAALRAEYAPKTTEAK